MTDWVRSNAEPSFDSKCRNATRLSSGISLANSEEWLAADTPLPEDVQFAAVDHQA